MSSPATVAEIDAKSSFVTTHFELQLPVTPQAKENLNICGFMP